ncbi:MAG: hypothetical protein HY303_01630 [Candidatus Wallbacteria bacterium]|nr:hypothetical protein [Candidatus Wallbacteria bacterium]
MDLEREGLPVVFYTDRGILKGKIALFEGSEVPDAVQLTHTGPPMVRLVDASLLDFEFRVVLRAREMAVNKNAILFAYEDEQAADLTRLKGMISNEDYEAAAAEVERLLLTNQRDAELFYLSGLVFERFEGDPRARECFQKALDLILDDKFRAVVSRHLA